MLLEPYSGTCADVNDRREYFIPPPAAISTLDEPAGKPVVARAAGIDIQPEPPVPGDDAPTPGTMSAGTRFNVGSYQITTSSHLHTQMMVDPDGLGVEGLPSWIYTTSTNRTHLSIEVVGMYRSWGDPTALLGLFAWPCFEDYPCPDGDTSSGWQFYHPLSDLVCNITHTVDQGGHAQKIMHYANHTDRLDDGDPPAWRNAIYLWNYCDAAWDLIWQHEYRQNKTDCSLSNACAWWGPVFELFGSDLYPGIPELGYEQGLLMHDGVWSELRPTEGAGFIDPAARPDLIPWQLFHLDPNRGFGAGSWFDVNDAPAIGSQQPLTTPEDTVLTIPISSLEIEDPDVDPAYHAAFELTIHPGDHYSHDGLSITPDADFNGTLLVPATVNDGAADSETFELEIEVTPVNDAPVVAGQLPLSTRERTALTIEIGDLIVSDPDNDASELVLVVEDGQNYERTGNTITPNPGVTGTLPIAASVTDGELNGAYAIAVDVEPDIVPPLISLLGQSTVELFVGDVYVDAGATALDDLDGDISADIVADIDVNVAVAGTYTAVYTVSDFAGNAADPAIRTIIVRVRTSEPGDDGGRCFIATAAYGSYLDPHVVSLRRFRDDVLARHRPGRWFIAEYYRHSPPIAKAIEQSEVLRLLTRLALTPIVLAVIHPHASLLLLAQLISILTGCALWRAHRVKLAGRAKRTL